MDGGVRTTSWKRVVEESLTEKLTVGEGRNSVSLWEKSIGQGDSERKGSRRSLQGSQCDWRGTSVGESR